MNIPLGSRDCFTCILGQKKWDMNTYCSADGSISTLEGCLVDITPNLIDTTNKVNFVSGVFSKSFTLDPIHDDYYYVL